MSPAVCEVTFCLDPDVAVYGSGILQTQVENHPYIQNKDTSQHSIKTTAPMHTVSVVGHLRAACDCICLWVKHCFNCSNLCTAIACCLYLVTKMLQLAVYSLCAIHMMALNLQANNSSPSPAAVWRHQQYAAWFGGNIQAWECSSRAQCSCVSVRSWLMVQCTHQAVPAQAGRAECAV